MIITWPFGILNGRIPELINTILPVILMTLLIIFLYTGKTVQKVLISALLQLAFAIIAIPLLFTSSILGIQYDEYWTNPYYTIFVNCILLNAALIPLGFAIRPFLGKRDGVSSQNKKALSLLSFTSYIGLEFAEYLIFKIINFRNSTASILIVFWFASLTANVIFLLLLADKMDKEGVLEKNFVLLQRSAEFSAERLTQLSTYSKEIEMLSTQMIETLDTLTFLLEDNNAEEAKQFIEKNLIHIKDVPRPHKLNNLIADYFVANLESRCKNDHIELETVIDLPEQIGIENMDFCTIVSNIIDNAIKACQQVEEIRYISLDIHLNGDWLYIGCKNSKSSKKVKSVERILGSFGLQNINETVESYNGSVHIDDQAECFLIEAIAHCKK
jgi:Signal transduction histidine kinase regulating citrate/malate metabolism